MMVADTATPARADLMRRYVELDAFEIVSANISMEVTGNEWEGTVEDVLYQLFPRENGDYEETVDWHLAQAESSALVGRVFAFLASEKGREFCSEEALQHCEIAEGFTRKVREMMAQ
jgi:hypothetical protein